MRRHEVDRRAKRTSAKQCLADTGHKAAGKMPRGRWHFVPLRDEIAAYARSTDRDTDDASLHTE
jgi:hypothetical protein